MHRRSKGGLTLQYHDARKVRRSQQQRAVQAQAYKVTAATVVEAD